MTPVLFEGARIGFLAVTEILGPIVRVLCDCGKRRSLYRSQLARGYRSCGCQHARAVGGRAGNRIRRIAWWPTEKGWAHSESPRAGAVPPTPRASATLGDEEEPRCA